MTTHSNTKHGAHDVLKSMINGAQAIYTPKPTAPPFVRMPSQSDFLGGMKFKHQPEVLPVPGLGELPMMLAALRAPARTPAPGACLVTLMGILLDESGSMDTGVSQTMSGYNESLDRLRPTADEIGCRVTQVNFNTQAKIISGNVEAKNIVSLSTETYRPGGGTALYDSTVALIKLLLSHPLAHDDNTAILLAITTDGEDLNSTTWKQRDMAAFRELMQAVAGNERWSVSLAGPDKHLRQFSELMCVSADNIAAFKPESVASRFDASQSSVTAMGNYAALRSTGMKKMDTMYMGTVAGASAKAILEPHGANVGPVGPFDAGMFTLNADKKGSGFDLNIDKKSSGN